MKINKKIIFILLGLFIIIGITYALWQGGESVEPIVKDATEQKTDRFTGPTNVEGVSAYTDTHTGLKWQANDVGNTYTWAASLLYTEPTWNGTNYVYPTGKGQSGVASTDYPAFAYCEGLLNGWRLPTKIELSFIMTDTKPDGKNYHTNLDSIYDDYYWSSTSYEANAVLAWNGNFGAGTVYINSKTDYKQVLCIHD